jgi:hypothetical protein
MKKVVFIPLIAFLSGSLLYGEQKMNEVLLGTSFEFCLMEMYGTIHLEYARYISREWKLIIGIEKEFDPTWWGYDASKVIELNWEGFINAGVGREHFLSEHFSWETRWYVSVGTSLETDMSAMRNWYHLNLGGIFMASVSLFLCDSLKLSLLSGLKARFYEIDSYGDYVFCTIPFMFSMVIRF